MIKLNVGPSDADTKFSDKDRRLWAMDHNQEHSVVINEYGSNMFLSKLDPLATYEAKTAIQSSDKTEWARCEEEQGGQDDSMRQVDNTGGNDENHEGRRVEVDHPSPINGTQEGPGMEWSSQEESTLVEEQREKEQSEEMEKSNEKVDMNHMTEERSKQDEEAESWAQKVAKQVDQSRQDQQQQQIRRCPRFLG